MNAGKMLPSSNQIEMGPLSSVRPLNSWTMAEYKQYMRANAPALAVFRQGLSKPFMSPRPKSYDDLHFEQYARFREIARRLSSEAHYYEKIGKYGLAASSALDAVDLGVTIPKGGPMIDALVGAAVESIGAKRLEEILPKLAPYDMTRVAARLDAIDRKRTSFADIMTEEAYNTAVITANLYGKADFRRQVMDPRNWIGLDSLRKPHQLWTDLDNAFCNKQNMIYETKQYYESVAREQKSPYTGESHVPVPSNPMTEGYSIYGSNITIDIRAAYTRAETISIFLRTEVALRRYRFDNGSYPAKLSDVAPKYLKKVPIDPFGKGKPLKYKLIKNGKGFLLYSLGPDMKDNRGMAAQWSGQSTVGDLVAGKW
ncbi:MAG: hypothetical protein ABFD83_10535 [Armatimonadota bacterium]